MRLNDFSTTDVNKNRKITDFENIFNINEINGRYLFNLNETLVLDFDPIYMSKYAVIHDLHWPMISFMIYQTTRLSWLLIKANKIEPRHQFDIVKAGTIVFFPKEEIVQEIITSLNQRW